MPSKFVRWGCELICPHAHKSNGKDEKTYNDVCQHKKTTKLILLCIWVLKQKQEILLLDHSNDRDRERTKKEEGNRKGTVVGIDIGESPRVDMISRFQILPFDLIRQQSHFALIFLTLLCYCVYQICLEKSKKELKREGPTTGPQLRMKEKGRGDEEREGGGGGGGDSTLLGCPMHSLPSL